MKKTLKFGRLIALVMVLTLVFGESVLAAEYSEIHVYGPTSDTDTSNADPKGLAEDGSMSVLAAGDTIKGGFSLYVYAGGYPQITIDGTAPEMSNDNTTMDSNGTIIVSGLGDSSKTYQVAAVSGQADPVTTGSDLTPSYTKPAIITLETVPQTTPEAGNGTTEQPRNLERGNHVHDLKWETIKEPTLEEDGLEAYMCECNYIEEKNVITAATVFRRVTLDAIRNASENGEIVIESDRWVTMSDEIMKAISERPDLTVKFRLRYEGQIYEIVIRPGTVIDTNERWYGVLKLVQLYGGYIVE